MAKSSAPVDAIGHLTPRWFTESLRETRTIDGSTMVTVADSQLFGTGQFGLVVRTELDYDRAVAEAPRSVIVKLASEDTGSRQFAAVIGAYEAEVRFYSEIAPRVSVDVPQVYWGGFSSETSAVTLVLEDLSAEWKAGDAVAGGDLPQSEAAIDQIVCLQSDLWDAAWLRDLSWLAPIERTQALFDVVPVAVPVFTERFAGRLRPDHLAMIEQLVPHAGRYPELAWRGPMVVTHGDFRLDNLLFRDRGSAVDASVIDWQAVRLGLPLIDVAIWLTSSLSVAQRREHQDALLRRYYDGLLRAGVADFTFGQCAASLRVCSLYVLLLGMGTSVALKHSERGDAMFAAMITAAAELVCDLRAATLFDEE